MTENFALCDSVLFTGEAFIEGHALLVKGGRILDLVPSGHIPDGFKKISLPHAILTPGFVDCQVNGGGNVLFNATPTEDAVLKIAAAHRKHGTTRLLPTVITDTPQITQAAIEAARAARKKDSSVLGIHVEGPHISEEYRGIHNASFVRPMSEEDCALYRPQDGEIFLLTLAPEVVAPALIEKLVKQGVLVSLGHSIASREQVRAALDAGATCFTHLFNRMRALATRDPGVAGYALDDPDSWAGIIADGVNLAPEMVRMAVKAKAENKLFLVSDAMPPAGADKPEPFDLCGDMIYPMDGTCKNDKGTLAGPLLTLGEIVPVAIRDIRLPPERVLRMASTIPAEFLGLGKELGKLLPGYKADIVALNQGFKMHAVWRDGLAVS